MRANEATVLVGQKVVLIPYRSEHVETYHAWMESEQLREQTASERLTLPQEHEMQQAWHLDQDKLTFIVCARPSGPVPDGGVPLGSLPTKQFPPNPSTPDFAHVQGRPGGDDMPFLESYISSLPMVGDVNLFFIDEEQGQVQGECEVMIAEPGYRRQGLGQEAVRLMMAYCTRSRVKGDKVTFMAKIGLSNGPSRDLFARVGFEQVKILEVFEEVEVRLPVGLVPRPEALVYHWPRP